MPEQRPNIVPVSDEKIDALFELWLLLDRLFSPQEPYVLDLVDGSSE